MLYSSYQPTYHDQTLDPLINQLLPQIEQSIKKQLLNDPQLQQQAQQQFQRELAKIQEQIQQQYQMALHELQNQAYKLQKQQTQMLKKQVQKLNKQIKNKQQNHMRLLQDRYVSQNFQEKILGHIKITQIQNQIAKQIYENSEQKIETTKQRRIKQIAIKMQNKQNKIKKQREKAIRNQVCQGKSVDQLKKDIDVMKIGLAAMKSQYNIKIKKVQTQIKQLKQKNKTFVPKQNITDLRKKLQQLQQKRDQMNQQILKDQIPQNIKIGSKTNETFSHLQNSTNEYDSLHSPFGVCNGSMQNNKNNIQYGSTLIQQNQYSQNTSNTQKSQEQQQQLYDGDQIKNPPAYHVSLKDSHQNLQTFENYAPILKLNVVSLLRTNWQDPLQRYVNLQNNDKNYVSYTYNNENDSKVGNKQSFQQIYHQHLQKLNQATKRRKLSAQAKKNIIKNLSMIKKNKV